MADSGHEHTITWVLMWENGIPKSLICNLILTPNKRKTKSNYLILLILKLPAWIDVSIHIQFFLTLARTNFSILKSKLLLQWAKKSNITRLDSGSLFTDLAQNTFKDYIFQIAWILFPIKHNYRQSSLYLQNLNDQFVYVNVKLKFKT